MTTAKQIITIEVFVDIDRIPLPENWDWNELTKELGGAARVNVLASGTPAFLPDAPAETGPERAVRLLFGTPKADPTNPENEGRN